MLDDIVKHCEECHVYVAKPRRFKFTLRYTKDFNQSIDIDVFFIDKEPIFHVVNEATRYQAARWLDRVNAPTMWNALRLCWIDVYLGLQMSLCMMLQTRSLLRSSNAVQKLAHSSNCVPVEAATSNEYRRKSITAW